MKKFTRTVLALMICCFAIVLCVLLAQSLSVKQDASSLQKMLNLTGALNILVKNTTVLLQDKTVLYYLEAKSPQNVKYRGNLIYLHGASYSSHDWNRNKPSILQLSAAAGYRTVAIDLPDFNHSRTKSPAPNNRSTFMSLAIKQLNMRKPIIISPSASGRYSIPYVLGNPKKISGFVAIAPCCVPGDGWENFTIPTLIVYGSRDKTSISTRLLKIPNKQLVFIPEAPHAAYIEKPIDFVIALFNFLSTIHS